MLVENIKHETSDLNESSNYHHLIVHGYTIDYFTRCENNIVSFISVSALLDIISCINTLNLSLTNNHESGTAVLTTMGIEIV